jgi:hypothetical protein
MINSLLACGPTTGDAKRPRRNPKEDVAQLERRGVELFNSTYGEIAAVTRERLSTIHPDFGKWDPGFQGETMGFRAVEGGTGGDDVAGRWKLANLGSIRWQII